LHKKIKTVATPAAMIAVDLLAMDAVMTAAIHVKKLACISMDYG